MAWCLVLAAPSFAVEYRVEFEGVWDGTHVAGGSLPGGAHFTTLVGATHAAGSPLWEPGALASTGVENVAELGNPFELSAEIQARIGAGTAGAEIEVGDIPSFPGMVQTTFEIELDDPNVTLISMIAPSPDWFVGVSDVALWSGGGWVESVTVDLRPYDAGTEEGSGFSLSNPATVPPEPIAPISGAPFVGSPVVGRIHFTLLTPTPSVPVVPAAGLVGLGATLAFAGGPGLRRRR